MYKIFGVLSARSIFNERLISCVRTREKWPFHHFLTLVIDKCSKEERNKLSDHFNCILVVRIDSTTCDRNMKENYFGVQNRVERFKGDGLLSVIVRENQAMAKDGGRPISLIFSAFETYQIRLRLVVFK